MQTELEYHEAKMKEYGWVQVPSLPVDAATQLKRDRRRAIAGMNAYRESLPEEVEGDYVATVDWEAEIAKAREEDFKKVLGIGEWFHDVPCEVKDVID